MLKPNYMKPAMKRVLSLLICLGFLTASMAQLKPKAKCPDLTVDILNGTVNTFRPNTDPEEFKASAACFTSSETDASSKCGGIVSYKDKDFYYYTRRKYFEIGPKFIGKISIPIMGTKRGSLFKTLGNPKMKDDLWDAYEMQYGTMVLHYDIAGPTGKVKRIQLSTEGTETLSLCE